MSDLPVTIARPEPGSELDGDYGRVSERALGEFRTRQQVEADGVAGPVTWERLWTAPSS